MASPLVVAILGPTGSGKSDLALNLAQTFQGEIVNFDSLQLYRHLDIGTAKTPLAERRNIPHHLLDIIDPVQVFTAGDYARAARTVLAEITSRGKLPILCGGTGFYLRALLYGLFPGPGRDVELRARLTSRPSERLHKLLARLDAAAAARIHANDHQKLIRAIEVCLLARKPISSLHAGQHEDPLQSFQVLKFGLAPDTNALKARIAVRTRRMFELGLIEEVRSLLTSGYPHSSKALEAIGYREALLYLGGELTLAAAIEQTEIATRQYAKRQRTWFRKEPDVHWLLGFGSDENVVAEAKEKVATLRNKSSSQT